MFKADRQKLPVNDMRKVIILLEIRYFIFKLKKFKGFL